MDLRKTNSDFSQGWGSNVIYINFGEGYLFILLLLKQFTTVGGPRMWLVKLW